MKLKRLVVTTLVGTSLFACQRQAESDVLADRQFSPSGARPEDRFGEKFGKAFRADPKSKPVEVKAGDLPPVSLTAEPIPID